MTIEELQLELGSLPAIVLRERARLLDVIVEAGLPIGRACRGDAICGACKVRVHTNYRPAISAPHADERRHQLAEDERLACRVELRPARTLAQENSSSRRRRVHVRVLCSAWPEPADPEG